MATALEIPSITYTYTPEDGPPQSLTFDEFVPEKIADRRIDAIADLVGSLIAEDPENSVLVPILRGGKVFMEAVMARVKARNPDLDPEIIEVQVSRYHGTEADKQLEVLKDFPDVSLAGKTAWIFDEVVDAGIAATWATNRARALGASRVIMIALVDKPEAHQVDIHPDIVGFETPAWAFLIGWGMDWHDQGADLKWIGRVRDGRTAEYTIPKLPSPEGLAN
jgi:hypoxanthine phosphoribosyltransferase